MPNKSARWYLTPNGLQVSAILAAEIARKGLKSLVFVQTIPWAISANNNISDSLGLSSIMLSESEKYLYELAADEAGGSQYLYLNVDEAGEKLLSASVCHHGHLMQSERSLHESLFKRPDGLNVLVATSTLSQGMNLPGDVVIIGGDSRFDLDADKMTQMEAHELLNAAGRAGPGWGTISWLRIDSAKQSRLL